MSNNDKVLQEIAKQFAIDYFSISSIRPKNENLEKVKREIFKESYYKDLDISFPCNVRNIVVLGAGATYDAYKEIPIAKDAVQNIKAKLGIEDLYNNRLFKAKIEEHEKSMKQIYKLNPREFESELSLLSNFVPSGEIQNQLSRLYKKRLYPSLFYELLAHLFKHRFIDVIINFNFDELLDQALEEELSHEDYYRIFSDGQCIPFDEVLNNGRMKQPIYIKPHGTISYKSSLKFTKEDYFGMSPDMKLLLSEIIQGKRGNDNLQYIDRVNLIVAGSSLKSFEFNEILKDNLPAKSAIYFFSDEEPNEDEMRKLDPAFTDKFFKHYRDGDFNRFYRVERDANAHNQLGKAFENMYRRMFRKKLFNPLYEPKDIYRHNIITEVFYNNEKGKRLFHTTKETEESLLEMDCMYMETRIYLEFIISLCKAKGKITLNELIQERFGHYYKLYCNAMKNKDNKLTIYKVFDYFGVLNCFSSSEQTITLKNRKVSHFMPGMLDKFCRLNEKTEYQQLEYFSNNRYKKGRVKFWLTKIYLHESLSIAPKFNYDIFFTFPKATEANIISTKLSLTTRFLGGDDNWDLLLVSSNKGKILLNLLNAEKGRDEKKENELVDYSKKFCCIVLEDDLYVKELEKLISTKRLLDDKINMSANQNYGDNIMLFLKRSVENLSEPWKFVKGIVCYRINESFKVFPYYVKDEEHYKILLCEFIKDYCMSNRLDYNKNTPNEKLVEFAVMFDKK